MAGKSKETAGKVTGDDRLEAEGKTQHDTAEGKEKAKSAADKAKGAVQGVKDAFSKDKR
ncbi:MAG TPA: CsbD family protein [Actinomycetota bacterium]|nr:CsbD family protein [Actinomycetota bacterium]